MTHSLPILDPKARDQLDRRLLVLHSYIALLKADPSHGPQRFVFEEGIEARSTPCRSAILRVAGQCGLKLSIGMDSFTLHPAMPRTVPAVTAPLVMVAGKPVPKAS